MELHRRDDRRPFVSEADEGSEYMPSPTKASNTKNDEIEKFKKKKLLWYQILIFTLTFFTYGFLHATREGWAFLKDKIWMKESPGIGFSDKEFGFIDSTFYITYGFCLFVSGNLGDWYSIWILMGIGFIAVAILHIPMGFLGLAQVHSVWYYIFLFFLSGIF